MKAALLCYEADAEGHRTIVAHRICYEAARSKTRERKAAAASPPPRSSGQLKLDPGDP